jgi:uncharacterized protein with HEPN domain
MKDKNLQSMERLLHMSEAIVKIVEFTENITEEEFINSLKINNAVLF